jgi:hypothetical protein
MHPREKQEAENPAPGRSRRRERLAYRGIFPMMMAKTRQRIEKIQT